MTTTHEYDVVIVGAGGAGMRAALESSQRARTAVLDQALPDAFPHGRRAGWHGRSPEQRRG